MALGVFIAGQYTGTYNAVATGMTRQGYTLSQTSMGEMMDETDAYGASIIDWVYRGGNCFMDVEFREWKAGTKTPIWPYAAFGILSSAALPIGRLASDVAQALVLTALANTPAATAADPATLTASKALLAPNFDARILFDSRFRSVPIRLQLLPYVSTNTLWFTTT
jgi:hypothetical protein